MRVRHTLIDYIETDMASAEYDKLEEGTFAGKIPTCPGVVAFAATLRECEEGLRSVLEDWLLIGLKLGHPPYTLRPTPPRLPNKTRIS